MSFVEATAIILFSLPFLGVGLAALGGSGYTFYVAGTRLLRSAHASITEPVEPEEAPRGSHATVKGEVVPGQEETLVAPLSGADAVAHRFRLEQQSDGVGWWTVAEECQSVPFELQGSVNRLSVDPGDEQPTIGIDESVELNGSETLPGDIRDRLAESDRFDLEAYPQYLASAVDEPRRYQESTLEIGETVYVYGYVTADDRLVSSESNEFRYGDEKPGEMDGQQSNALRSAAGFALLGVFLLLFGGIFTIVGGLMLLGGIDAHL